MHSAHIENKENIIIDEQKFNHYYLYILYMCFDSFFILCNIVIPSAIHVS